MKAQYDFSKGERGKFYRPDAALNLPLYLDPDVDAFMRQLVSSQFVGAYPCGRPSGQAQGRAPTSDY